jgi:crotonobetainyl-CoA:carnitine CoA-transferase CaiB-like acyl-CoA transferase
MNRMGLAYDEVASVNPRIIYCALHGFGEDGPYAGKSAYDDMIQGASSLPSLAARATGEPHYAPSAIADRIAGMTAVYAVLAAVYARGKTGLGQSIAIPMFERMVEFVLSDHMYGWTFDPPIGGTGYPRQLAPDRRPYKTKDGYICAMPYLNKHWQGFFDITGMHDLKEDPRFVNLETRTQNIRVLYQILAEALLARTTDEWMAAFTELDIPAMPLHTPESVMSDPHLLATGFFQMVEHPSEGRIRTMAVPMTWTGTPPEIARQAPRLGEHSVEVLKEIGYSDARLAELASEGVIAAG